MDPVSWKDPPRRRPLVEHIADPGYAAHVGGIVQEFGSNPAPQRALTLLSQAVVSMGAENGAFASFVKDDDSQQSYRFLLACDPTLCRQYEQQSWYSDDPWLHYAQHHSEPILGEDVPATTPAQQRIVRLVRASGFRSSVVVPAPASGGVSRVGVMALGSAEEDYFSGPGFATLKIVARGVAMEIHDWFVRQARDELMREARLSDEDLWYLRQEWDGAGTKQIAARRNMSLGSVNSRFQRINAKLGVPTRRAAARLATEYGLI